MDAVFLIMALRMGILIYMMGFTLRHRDWCGFAIVFIYLAMIIANTILLLPYVTSFLGTPLVVLISWYIINKNRSK
jgi:hypothetical protein